MAVSVKTKTDQDNAETRSVLESEVLGQGDIFELIGQKQPPFMGVVINADCDLANGKTDGVVSYLPVYTLEEYVHEFWLSDFIAGQKTQLLREILVICKASKEDEKHLTEWLGSDDCDTISESLSDSANLNEKTKKRLSELLQKYQHAFGCIESPVETFSKICSNQKDEAIFAKKQLQSAYKQMGDGHLVINEVIGKRELGFVVRMRRIYSIDERDYFRSRRQHLTSKSTKAMCAVRMAKLTPIFQFKLAQLFAYQFSRVGLPDAFKDMHSMVIDDLADKFLEIAP